MHIYRWSGLVETDLLHAYSVLFEESLKRDGGDHLVWESEREEPAPLLQR